jgi:hypothetical protein
MSLVYLEMQTGCQRQRRILQRYGLTDHVVDSQLIFQ